MSPVRWLLGALGLLLIGVGGLLLAAEPDPFDVLVWLAGALVLHDGVLAPLVLGAGLLLAAAAARWALPARRVLRGALITAGALTLITLPLLLRPGTPAHPSALPLPYPRNLLLALAAVAVTAAAVAAVAVRSRRRPPRPSAPPDGPETGRGPRR
ncbi:hypothetical protein EF918_25615 [Streptomyces sp. WAC06614]|nr:hypothetical protein EF918_25615 [Streptomyces sp. WAC06614]